MPICLVSPHYAPLFDPATPGSMLQQRVKEVANMLRERMERMSVKVIENAGEQIGQLVVTLDLAGCWSPNCYLCVARHPAPVRWTS